MSSVSPRVKDSVVPFPDSESDICKRKPTEVTEELVVLEVGILPELHGPLPEPVSGDITTELR